MKNKGLWVFLIMGALLVFTLPGYATSFTYNLDFEYSGGAEPVGPSPWLTATFDDEDTPGSVQLTMDAAGLTRSTDSTEFVTKWLFNVNAQSLAPGFDIPEQTLLDALEFNLLSGPPPSALNLTANSSDLNPAVGFDIEFSFPTSNGTQDRFEAGETVIFEFFSDLLPITANTFLALNSSGKGPLFETAAHVQGIVSSAGDSGKIAPGSGPNPVPEPTTMLLVGIGLIGLIGFGCKRFKA
jgi:hypothetical protein